MPSDRERSDSELAEPRNAPRLLARLHPSDPSEVNFAVAGRAGRGILHDISLSGARIESASERVAVGLIIDLYFLFGRGKLRSMHAVGTVVRETETGFAVRFSRVERELEQLVLAERPTPQRLGPDAPPSAGQLPPTALRARYERSRTLSLDRQIEECAEYISNPGVLACEFLESFAAIERSCGPDDVAFWRHAGADGSADEIVLGHFHEGLEVTVLSPEPYTFTCFASNLSPLGRPCGASVDDSSGLDYLGVVGDPCRGLALGVTPWVLEFTPHSLFMRVLNCLAELAPPAQIRRINREFPNVALEIPPHFDLHLVLSHGADSDEFLALVQLTRDLAEKLKTLLNEAAQFPAVLGDVLCLRIDEAEVEGHLDLDWRV